MKRLISVAVALTFVFGLSPSFGEEEYEYVSARKCKICHSTDKKAGTHYDVWEEGPHAKAFETLLTDKAKESAKKHGIDDPSKAEACLSCHTAVGSPKPEEGVSCESCHGPASGYRKIHEKEGYEAAIAAGMVDFRNMDQEAKAETCKQCHREDPMNDFYKPFDYEEYYKKIDHTGATSPKVLEEREKEK